MLKKNNILSSTKGSPENLEVIPLPLFICNLKIFFSSLFFVIFTELLLETMNGVDILGTHEALIYCVGSLKFLTGNATIAKQLVQKHCIEKLSTLLDSIIKLVCIKF